MDDRLFGDDVAESLDRSIASSLPVNTLDFRLEAGPS
jgi:hypothetical protein